MTSREDTSLRLHHLSLPALSAPCPQQSPSPRAPSAFTRLCPTTPKGHLERQPLDPLYFY